MKEIVESLGRNVLLRFIFIICLASPFITLSLWSQERFTWNGSVSDAWSVAENWTPAGIPGAIDTAVISSGSVQISGELSLASLWFSLGVLTINDTLTVSDTLNWSGGRMFGSGKLVLSANALGDLHGSENKEMYQVGLENRGIIRWSGDGNWLLSSRAIVENHNLIELKNNSKMDRGGGDFPYFYNRSSGVLRKLEAGSHTSFFGHFYLMNEGSIEVLEGSIDLLCRGTFSGDISVSNGSDLLFGDNLQEWTSTCSLSSNGNVIAFNTGPADKISYYGSYLVAGATIIRGLRFHMENGAESLGDSLIIEGGTFSFSGDTIHQKVFVQKAGILDGDGGIIVDSSLTWYGGRMNGSGFLELGDLSVGFIDSDQDLLVSSRSIINRGELTFTGSGDMSFSGYPATVFRNHGSILLSGKNSFTGSARISNEADGIIWKDAGDDTIRFEGAIQLDNLGELALKQGGLQLYCNGNYGGILKTEDSTFLEFSGGSHNFSDTSKTQISGILAISGSSRVNFEASFTVPSGTIVEDGILGGQGTVFLNDTMYWQKGTFADDALFWIDKEGVLIIKDHTGIIFRERKVRNDGLVVLDRSTLTISTNSVFNNRGLFQHNSSGSIVGQSFGISGTFPEFNNLENGAFHAHKTDTLTKYSSFNFNNYGVMLLDSSYIDFRGSISNGYLRQHDGTMILDDSEIISLTDIRILGGELKGDGRIIANVKNHATVNPGVDSLNFGILYIEGEYFQDTSATLVIDAGGKSPLTGHDQLTVNTANVAGLLDLKFQIDTAFNPYYNSRFRLVRWLHSDYEGEFDSIANISYSIASELGRTDTIIGLTPVYGVNDLTLYGKDTRRDMWFQFNGKKFVRPGQNSYVRMHYGNRTADTLVVPMVITLKYDIQLDRPKLIHFPDWIPWEPPVDEAYFNSESPREYPFPDESRKIPIVLTIPPANKYTDAGDYQGVLGFSAQPDCGSIQNPSIKGESGNPVDQDVEGCIKDVAGLLLGLVPGGDCVQAGINLAVNGMDMYTGGSNDPQSTHNFLVSTAWDVVSCASSLIPGASLVKTTVEVVNVMMTGYSAGSAVYGCANAFMPKPYGQQTELTISCVQSKDPNEKVGPDGSGRQKYIVGDSPAVYSVYFENMDSATAPAQNVYITDYLNPDHYDLSTFSFLPITIGDTTISVPSGSFEKEVDLSEQAGVLVLIRGEIDYASGLVRWTFTSLDPLTHEPVEDALAGFLPPNISSPEGEGNVVYMVEPNLDLGSGTAIGSDASIVFDNNEAIITNEWINHIDRTEPQTHLISYAETLKENDIPLTWSGTDSGSGISQYILFVSKDLGDYEEHLVTSDTAYVFHGDSCSEYRFYTLGVDSAGNFERPKHSEVQVIINPFHSLEIAMDKDPNICIGDSITLSTLEDSLIDYAWYRDNVLLEGYSDSYIQVTEEGDYTVFATGQGECQGSSAAAVIIQHPLPQATIQNNDNELSVEAGFASYQWYLNDTVIQGSTDHFIQAERDGIYRVEVTNEFGCPGISEDFEHSVVDIPTYSMDEIRVYPNPARENMIFIKFYNPSNSSVVIKVIDQSGSIVIEEEYQALKANRIVNLDIAKLEKGSYYIQIVQASKTHRLPIIKL